MDRSSKTPAVEQRARAKSLRLEAMRLQEVEANPLDAGQIAMFEMFERENWSHERRTQYLIDRAKRGISLTAAE